MLLLESIQIKNGKPQRLSYHNQRLHKSREQLFCNLEPLFLEEHIEVPSHFQKGIVKCRIIYDAQLRSITYEPYQPRKIDSFYLVSVEMDYSFKYADRQVFNQLKSAYPDSSEIILVKNGFITDSTYSNLIFKDLKGKWWTPQQPLLAGTQREYLLDEGWIEETSIRPEDLLNYSHFKLINAMLDMEKSELYDVHQIINIM